MSRRPNIVYILNDHQAFYGHGTMVGGPKIQRPNIEKLATRGIEFTQAYTACPLCGPARRTMLTGLYPHNHGEIKNESNHKYDRELYLTTLSHVGYKNYYYGKWHAGRGTALNFECEGFSCPGYGNPYASPDYKNYLKKYNLPFFQVKIEKSFIDPNHSFAISRGIKEGGLHSPKFPVLSEETTGIMTTPKETHEAFFLASLACQKLHEIVLDHKSRPFHLRVDFWGPHFPYFATQEFLDLYEAKSIPELPSFRDDLKSKPELYKSNLNYPISKNSKLIIPSSLPWEEWQKVLALNYAQQTLIDEAGGMILNTLEELGLIDDTIIIWASDHGDALGCHGGHFDKDGYMPEEMVRTLMVISYPDFIPKSVKCNELVSNLDIGPTFLDAAGISYKQPIDGQSLLPLCRQNDIQWRDDIMCETHGHWTVNVGRMIIHDHYKYIWNEGDMDELYNLNNDPFELDNLINNNDYKDVLLDLTNRLKKWQLKTGDKVFSRMIKGKKFKK